MSNYIPSDTVTIEWQGDIITCEMEPVTNEDFAKLMPYFQENDNGDMVLRFEDKADFARISGELLPAYVTGFTGLTDARGNPVDFDTVLNKLYFVKLKSELVNRLFALSTPTGDDEKKSDEPSAPDS